MNNKRFIMGKEIPFGIIKSNGLALLLLLSLIAFSVKAESYPPIVGYDTIDFEELSLGNNSDTILSADFLFYDYSKSDTINISSHFGTSKTIINNNWSSTIYLETSDASVFSLAYFEYFGDDPWNGGSTVNATVYGIFTNNDTAKINYTSNENIAKTLSLNWTDLKRVIIDFRDGSTQSYGAVDNFIVRKGVFPKYSLTVNSGTGSGNYEPGTIIDIVALPPAGQGFDVWTGDSLISIADTNSASTQFTMPTGNAAITALFKPAYSLTVSEGTGSGDYIEGAHINISATPPAGFGFDIWTGDTQYVADVNSAQTSVTMPASAISITSTFRDNFGIQDSAFIFVNSSENHIYINNFIDTALGNPNLSFNAISRNTNIIAVIGVDYTSGDNIAILKIEEKGLLGEAYVVIEVSDDNHTSIDSVLVSVENYTNPGINFEIHDIDFWQQYVPINSTPVFDTTTQTSEGPYPYLNWDNIPLTTSDGCEGASCTGQDLFTSFYKGILIPPTTGDYTFYVKSQDHKGFWLSSNKDYDNAVNLIHSGQGVGEAIEDNQWKSATQALIAGKPYAFYATQWIIHGKIGGILMEGPGIAKDYINGEYMMPVYDTDKPSVVENIELLSLATTTIKLSWPKSSDNIKVSGYRIYVNGILYNTELIEDLTTVIEGLTQNTDYSITITAVDQLFNESLSSSVLNVTTYEVEATPPTPPTSMETLVATGVSVKLRWSGASDNQAVIAYNLFINGVLYNESEYLLSDSTIVYGLMPDSTYLVNIIAFDPSYNASVKSDTFYFTTGKFNPNGPSLGEKIARVKISMENITWNEGIGINGPFENGDFVHDPTIRALVKEMHPGTVRWGGIGANSKSLSGSTGTGKANTYGEMLSLANEIGCKFSLTVGVETNLDYMTDTNTFTHLIEYLAGPTGTTWGDIRASEGFTEPLLQNSAGILIEFGNEVWGGATHDAQIGANYTRYTKWCRNATAKIKASPYYDSNKITMVYSGRNPHPDDSYGLTQKVLLNDNGELECLALSGYLGGNLNYDPEIPQGESELNYYQYGYDRMRKNLEGFFETMQITFDRTGDIIPFYLYESNMTTPGYNGKFGQAIIMTDYLAQSMEYGVILPSLFHLNSGEWKIVRTSDEVVRLPLYNMAKLYNRHCKGHVLNTELETTEYLVNGDGSKISLPPVGIHAYNEGTKYSILLMSRDFENDFTIQLDLPSDFTSNTTAKKYLITSDGFSSTETNIDSIETVFKDGLLVELPMYSMVLLTFTGEDQEFEKLPLGYFSEVKAESITITPDSESAIIENKQKILLITDVYPDNTSFNNVTWEVINSDSITYKIGKSIFGVFFIEGSGKCDGNGTIILRASSERNPSVYAYYIVNISGQGTDCESTNVDVVDIYSNESSLWFYPNPVSDQLVISNPIKGESVIKIHNIAGKQVLESIIIGETSTLDLFMLEKGVYIISLKSGDKIQYGKLIKQNK